MLSLKNVKSPDSNFVNFPKVGAYEESLPALHKRGGGADEDVYIPGFNPVCNVFNHTACLYRQ